MKKFTAAAVLAVSASLVAGIAPATADEAPATASAEALDLQPVITVAEGKAPGFAGLAAVRVKNVGSERYYGDFPAITFKIEVKTDEGPEGVDRLITPGWFNGAYTRDLGFNKETSTRTFETTLSNPVEKGDTQLIANLNFGDGNTKEGRLKNYITVTQTGRLEGDTSTANDQDVDSRTPGVTKNHMGKDAGSAGIF